MTNTATDFDTARAALPQVDQSAVWVKLARIAGADFVAALMAFLHNMAEAQGEYHRRNGHEAFLCDALVIEVGRAYVKIIGKNRNGDGSIGSYGNIRGFVALADGSERKRGDIFRQASASAPAPGVEFLLHRRITRAKDYLP